MRKYLSKTTLVIAIIATLLAAVGVLGWKYYQVSKGSDSNSSATSKRIIEKVGLLYLIPTNEEPTVALIQDKNKLGNQEFFKSAQNGDYLLVYQKNKIALVYRENANKLVNVGPVNIGENSGTKAEQSTP